jgi:hypothetical protein
MTIGIIALDAYAWAWERAFGTFPKEANRNAYWPMDRWRVTRLSGAPLERLRDCFDEGFWSSIPAMRGALEACAHLQLLGYELVCVTALPERFAAARARNLQDLGFPIKSVIATDNNSTLRSPKADALSALKPVAFVDDFAPYLAGVDPSIHRALVIRDPDGSPNCGDHLRLADSQHANLLEFSIWWSGSQAHEAATRQPLHDA